MLATLLVGFGLDSSVTRSIAARPGRADLDLTSFLIIRVSLITPLLVVGFIAGGRHDPVSPFIFLQAGVLIGQATFPLPLLQGIGRLDVASMCLIGGRLVGIVAVFVFVHTPDDAGFYCVILSLQALVSSTAAWMYSLLRLAYRPTWNGPSEVLSHAKSGLSLYLASLSHRVYSGMNTPLVASTAGLMAAGQYAGAERIVLYSTALLGPLPAAVFQRSSALAASSAHDLEELGRSVLWIALLLGGGLTIITVVTAPLLPKVLGAEYEGAVAIVRALALVACPAAVGDVLAQQFLIPLQRDARLAQINVAVALAYVPFAYALGRMFGPIGVSFIYVCSEVVVTGARAVTLLRSGIRLGPPNISRRRLR